MGTRLLTVAKEAIASLPLHGRQVENPLRSSSLGGHISGYRMRNARLTSQRRQN